MNIYPPATYRIWLCDPRGVRLELVDNFSSLSFARAHGAIGRGSIQVPLRGINHKLLQRDYVWQIWRTPYGGLSKLVFAGMARYFRFAENDRQDVINVTLEDGNGLLYSRVVAYPSDGTKTQKTDVVDDFMKDIARENLGSTATDSDRDLSAYDFAVQSDVGLGPSTTLDFAHQRVGETLDKLFWDSAAQGTPVFYDVEPTLTNGGLGWTFVTSTGQLGNDRTYTGGTPVIFSRNFGNLEEPELTFDYTSEVTVARVGGQGEGSFREIVESIASGRRYESPWNRREVFVDARNLSTTTELTNKAAQVRREGRPIKKFTGKLKDSPQSRYGVDWFYGDKVLVKTYGVSFEAWINAVSIGVDENRRESLDTRAEVLL